MTKIFYLAQVFDTIHNVSLLVLIISAISLVISTIFLMCSMMQDSEYYSAEIKYLKVIVKYLTLSIIISGLSFIFIPTKDTYLFMKGGEIIDNIVEENPDIEELPANTLNLLNEYIKVKTEDLRERNN